MIFWPILLKLHISASEMDSFLTPYRLWNFGEENLQFTPFGGGPKRGCSDGLRTGTIKSHNFSCLRSYPGEISHSNSANRELSINVSVLVLFRRKVTPFHTLRQLKRDEALFPPLRRVVAFRARYRQLPVQGFFMGGRQNLETVRPTVREL